MCMQGSAGALLLLSFYAFTMNAQAKLRDSRKAYCISLRDKLSKSYAIKPRRNPCGSKMDQWIHGGGLSQWADHAPRAEARMSVSLSLGFQGKNDGGTEAQLERRLPNSVLRINTRNEI